MDDPLEYLKDLTNAELCAFLRGVKRVYAAESDPPSDVPLAPSREDVSRILAAREG